MAVKKLLPAIGLVALAFFLGIIFGSSFSNQTGKEVAKLLRDSEIRTQSFVLEQEMLEEEGCSIAPSRLARLSDELYSLGKMLESERASQELGKENYHYLKRKFHLLQIQTFTLYKKYREKCGLKEPFIVFYFSRNHSPSAEQGIILDRIVKDYNAKVFAIELGYSPELDFLEKAYSIETSPSLIINGKKVKKGLASYEEVKALID